ncbi:MAG: hypothetical protein PHN44_05160 [Candidatus Marinimicrobia bacterium]|nr:hypothetical protein [Candidatus Neomarinimicrobiota bacterium]
MNTQVVNHGDIILYPIQKLKPSKDSIKAKLHVLQASEVTGNRHEVVSDSLIYRWTKNGVEYIHCDKNYKIQHVGGDCEHGVLPIVAGTYELRHEDEYNPWMNELRRVID